MKKIFYIFLSRPATASMLFFSIIILGLAASFNLPLELSPHVEFPKLTISFSWSNVSPETIEAFVTSPIESELAGIKGVKSINSNSSQGSAEITVEFYPDINMDFARVEINEKISALKDELPYGISPPRVSSYIPDDFRDLQGFITYSISSNESGNATRKYVKENLLFPLMSISGISDVSLRGGNEREINIEIDYEKVKNLGITNDEISKSIAGIENMQSLGKITKDGKQYFIKANNSVTSIEKISNYTVKIFTNGKIIKLKDIGSVFDDFKETSNYYRINGKETVSLVINREEGSNALDVAKKVYEKITELKSKLPADYIILKEIDKSESIRVEIRELTKNAVYSFIIIVIVLLLIFRSIKISLIISVSIIFSLFFSFLLFFLFEIPLNIITISSFILGFGFMVDNSIVVVDFIEQHYSNDGIKRLAILLTKIFKPVFAATLTTVAVFIPLLFLTGELKLYFEQFALGIIITLFASLVVSFTIIPMLFIKYHKKLNNSSAVKKITIWDKSYCLIERFIFHWKKMSLILLILIIGLPVWLIPTRLEESAFAPIYNSIFDTETYSEIKPYLDYALGGSLNLFFNHINRGEPWQFGEETYIYVRLELPNGNKIDKINKLTKDFEKEILRYKANIKTLITNVYDEENANLKIDFNSKQGQTAFPYILKNYLTSFATRLGGLNVSVYGFGPGFSNAGSSFSNFSVISKGFNYLNTRKLAEDFKSQLIQNPRIDNVDIDKSEYFWDKDTYEIIAKVKRKELAGFNISPDEIISTITKNTEGNLSWNTFRMDNDEVEYNIKFSNYKNIQLNELENLFVVIKNSSLLKVKDVMDFEVKKVLSSINREDQQYIRYITFDYKGPFKYGDELIKSIISKMNIKEGYSLAQREFSFRFGEEEEVEVWNILFYAVILIFMITASLFESLIKPILIITAIPFAIIGTFFLFYFTDLNLDRGAYAGILLLIGLAVNNSIILTDYISKNKNVIDFNEIIKLSSQRLRPIFTTTLTTIAALVPLLIGSEATFWRSLSYSVLGGLLLSSIVVVLFIPIFYYLISRNKKTIKLYYSHN